MTGAPPFWGHVSRKVAWCLSVPQVDRTVFPAGNMLVALNLRQIAQHLCRQRSGKNPVCQPCSAPSPTLISWRSSAVNFVRFTLLSLAVVTGVSGCHCMPITERYADRIDCIADHEGCMDRFYHPCLDVTRWGMWNCPCCNCRPQQHQR